VENVSPLEETAQTLGALLGGVTAPPSRPVFTSAGGKPLTRYGIYEVVRRHGRFLDRPDEGARRGRTTPHVFRHYLELRIMRSWGKTADDLPGDPERERFFDSA
jgi:integrase